MIKSSQNPRLKLVRALAGRPKERREARAFLAEGVRLVEEALAAKWPFRFALHSEDLTARGQEVLKRIQDAGIENEEVESRLLQSLSQAETSQGLLAVLNESRIAMPTAPNFLLIPDSIRDPGNLGALLRTADAAGVQAVLLPPETTDAFGAKVVRAGMGAHFRLPIQTADWNQIRRFAESMNLNVYLADTKGESCWETDLHRPLALIVGGEAEGGSPSARKLATRLVSIPMPGKAESLNAAVAGSILMFEVVRQSKVL